MRFTIYWNNKKSIDLNFSFGIKKRAVFFIKPAKLFLVTFLIFTWIFSGWPQIWNNPPFPPRVQKAFAATATQTYTFDSDTESWTATSCGTAGGSCSHQAGDGSPANGSIEESETRKNKGGTWTWELSGITWESLGVPSGGTVTQVDGSYNHTMATCTDCNTSGSNTSGTLLIRDSGDSATIATLETAVTYGGAASWASRDASGAQSVGASYQASNTSIILRITGSIQTNNVNGAEAVIRQDQISFTITYTFTVPTVSTDPASSITSSTATLNGNITNIGDGNATDRGFAYGTDPTLATVIATTTESGDFGTGTFSSGVSSLDSETTYYFRAYATNAGGTGFGSIEEFTTSGAASLTFVVSTDNFPNLTPGTPVYATSTLSVDTNNSGGWYVTLYGNNVSGNDTEETAQALNDGGSNEVTDLDPQWTAPTATTTTGMATAISEGDDVLAFRVMTASGTPAFISTAWWGADDTLFTNARWAGIASSTNASKIGATDVDSGGSPALNTVQFYLDVPVTQPMGTYTGTITFTAVMN